MLKSPKLMLSAAVVLGAMCLVSCEKDVKITDESGAQMSMLGKQLENPYSVKNMRKAYASLMEKQENQRTTYEAQILQDSMLIQATDYYVRFLIENDEQRHLLLADSLNLSVVPLDVEIYQEEDYYIKLSHPSIPKLWGRMTIY